MINSEGLHTWVGMHIVEYVILWYHDTVKGILNQNISSRSTKPISERVLKVNYGHLFWMVKLEGGHTWVGMHTVEYGILWYHDIVHGILNENVNTKNT